MEFKKNKTYLTNHIHSADTNQIVVEMKKEKKRFLMHYDPVARVFVLSNGAQDTTL